MSGNRNELRNARRAANEAAATLEGILALPRRRGSLVRWANGVVWRREGDDDWRPDGHWDGERAVHDIDPVNAAIRYSSAHVASFGFWVVSGR